jgi:hypothetical protein
MPSPEVKRTMLALGLFLMPAILVKTTGLYLGRSGPVEAQAASNDPAAPSTVPSKAIKPLEWTPRQIAAGKYIESLRDAPMSATPFLNDARIEAVPIKASAAQESVIDKSMTPPPKFALQAILASTSGQTALIGGRPYHEGDKIKGAAGWIVQSISVESRSAILKDTVHNRVITITVEMPLLKSDGQ